MPSIVRDDAPLTNIDVRTVQFFPPAESCLDSDFRRLNRINIFIIVVFHDITKLAKSLEVNEWI